MSAALYPYYERELRFIRQMAQDFARQYPAAAGRLLLEPNRSADPHVERLIESFALLAGRIHHKLDDEFPELTDALLSLLYPHYLAPIPSLAIVQLLLDPARGQLPRGFTLPRGTRLTTPPVDDVPCRFRTCYPTSLWPIEVTGAKLQGPPFHGNLTPPPRTVAALRLQLECTSGMKLADLELDRLRFYLYGDNALIAQLYEVLFNNVIQVVFRAPSAENRSAIALPPQACLSQVGFGPDETLLPYPRRSFRGYGLLTEVFSFPAKFHFVDVGGWDRLRQAGWQTKAELILFLSRTGKALEQGVNAGTFRLGCTPVVNLFEQTAEPLALTQTRYEYKVIPDVHHPHGLEVYSVDSITGVEPSSGVATEYRPFYALSHAAGGDAGEAYWYATRRPGMQENDRGSDVYLSLVDRAFAPQQPAESTLVIRTTCTNRDLPAKLQGAGEALRFSLESAAPVNAVQCLRTPTAPLRPGHRRGRHWRLLSHLSLNYLSLTDPDEGRTALQEILRLYDFANVAGDAGQLASVTQQLIEGITALRTRRVVGRTGAETASGFCRGIEVTLEFDEKKYLGTGVFLFASVLERFLGLYASVNSFSQLVATLQQQEGYLKKWPPRAGEQVLL